MTACKTEDGTVVYALSEDGDYSEEIPTGTDAGAYTVWYKVIGDKNHNDTEPASVEVTVAKADPVVTAPEANTLTADGTEQALVKAGSTENGTIVYAVTSEDTAPSEDAYTETVPTAAGAETYFVSFLRCPFFISYVR